MSEVKFEKEKNVNFERNDKEDGAPSERLLRSWAEARAMPSVDAGATVRSTLSHQRERKRFGQLSRILIWDLADGADAADKMIANSE